MSRRNVSDAKVGDRARATCGESVVVGEVTKVYESGVLVVIDGDRYGSRWINQLDWTVEVLAPPIPDVVGTVVLDTDGDAWQRDDEFWRCVSSVYYKYTLADLQFRYGPLTVLWTPKATP